MVTYYLHFYAHMIELRTILGKIIKQYNYLLEPEFIIREENHSFSNLFFGIEKEAHILLWWLLQHAQSTFQMGMTEIANDGLT